MGAVNDRTPRGCSGPKHPPPAVQLLHQAARFLDVAELHPDADPGLRRLLAAAEAKIGEALRVIEDHGRQND